MRQPAGRAVGVGVSGAYDIPFGSAFSYQEIRITLKTAGTSDTSLSLLKNGVVAAFSFIGAGLTEASSSFLVPYLAGDNMQVSCTQAGVGASGLTVMVR